FIGSKLSRRLVEKGYSVTILDNLSPQIHGDNLQYCPLEGVRFIKGDVRSRKDWEIALEGAENIVHLAAETGTGQSMYEVHKYVDNNINGTAVMLDCVVNKSHNVSKIIIASSRAVYGEGKYQCEEHGVMYPPPRQEANLAAGKFEPVCPQCNNKLKVFPTDEESKIHPASIYGITKLAQEQLVLNVCKSVNLPAIAFRYQNVYGPGQSLKNPYTGILSIFSTQIRNGKTLNVFEDGLESRDFVYIDDAVKATMLVIESEAQSQDVLNVGSGSAMPVFEAAKKLKELYRADVDINITGNYRIGDIRHNIADLAKIKKQLAFEPEFSFNAGIKEFSKWVLDQEISSDQYDESIREMSSKGLLKSI